MKKGNFMKNKILTIGPVTKDIIKIHDNTYTQIGGASYYQVWTLHQLKKEVTAIITIGQDDCEMLKEFPDTAQVKPIIKKQTMQYTNIYNKKMERIQKAILPSNTITPQDIEDTKINLSEYKTVLISPLSKDDIPPETIEYLKNKNMTIVLSIQGYLRTTDTKNNVISRKWENKEQYLKNTDIITLDENEIKKAFNIKEITNEKIQKIIRKYNLNTIIITKAEKGSDIYTHNNKTHIPAIETDKQIDPTGLGDTYIAAYISKINKNNIYEAGLYASITAKFKLEQKGPLKIDKKIIQKELEKRLN